MVLCAGHNVVTPFGQITVQEWQKVLEVNLSGAFFALQAPAPLVRPGPVIVTVASVAAHTRAPHHMHYDALCGRQGRAGEPDQVAGSSARPAGPGQLRGAGDHPDPMGQDTIDNLADDYAATSLLLKRFATPRRMAQLIALSPARSPSS